MKPIDSNKSSTSELEDLRSENERLKKILAKNGLMDHPSSYSILNSLPVAVWEEDFSDVKRFLDELSQRGVTDFNWYFTENPDDVKHCASLIKVISVNETALKITGIPATPERIDDLPVIFKPEYQSIFKDEFVVLAEGGTSFRSNAVTIDTEARAKQIIVQVNVVEGHELDLSRVLVTVTDITKESDLKEELERSEIQWRSIFESLVDGIMIIDKSFQIIKTNFNTLDMPSANNPLGKSVIDLVVPEEKDEARAFYTDVFENGKTGKTEHRSKNGGAETIHNIIASPLKIDGEVEHVVVVARNMTSQRNTKQELVLLEARSRSIFNHASDLIYIVNRDYVVTEANQPALRIISDQMVGNSIKDVIMPENVAVVTEMIADVFKTNKPLQTVIKIPEGDYKGHLYSCDISTLPNPEGPSSAIIIARDITESKNHEKQVLDALIQGQERERKRVARELHDGLGQLFTALNLNMQLFKLRNKAALDDQANDQLEELANIVEMAISEVKGISKNLLPDALNHHGLVPALHEVIQALKVGKTKIYFEPIDANKRYPEKVELAIFRALQELLNNAIKYANAETIDIQLVDHEYSLVLTVEDDGKGMDETKLNAGNGLGNIKARTEAIGGTFYIEGAPGKGTLAYIEIPIKTDK
ncbi:MAG: PAS domain S-box-containing protein [Bacteroidia bacterium]|jgi:PAS domain S-box-containing protein